MRIFLWTVYALSHREIVRFYRQKNRVIGALAAPVLFWFLIGSGMGRSFQYEGGYLQYFFPGTLLMMVLFTAIFSSISIIEDRREGFMQSVLAAPCSPAALAMGKMVGGALLAWTQALLFLPVALFLQFHFTFFGLFELLALLFFMSLGLTGLGFFIAWKMDSVQGFHAMMNLLLMPMWFLSGALFPAENAPLWLRFGMLLNPLTYALRQLRDILSIHPHPHNFMYSLENWAVTLAFSALAVVSAILFRQGHWKTQKV